MSMILEALRRADRERQEPAPAPPNLTTVHQPPVASSKQPHKRLMSGLMLLLAGAGIGVALAYWQWTVPANLQATSPEQSVSIEPASQEPPGADTAPASRQALEPVPESRPTQTERPAEVARLYHSDPERSAQAPEIHRLYNPPEPAPAPIVRNEAEVPPEPPPEPRPQPQPEPEPQSAPQPSLSTGGALSIRALPSSMQRAIPSIYYQGHHYQDGQDDYVVLNRREYRPGDEVVSGVILERIAEDGIVLSFRGEQFRLARLSSWVNL